MKNKGYTLLEAIIVISIIAIALTLTFLSINNIYALNVREASQKLVSELGKEKVACMTHQGKIYMRLYKDGSGIHVDEIEDKDDGHPTVTKVDIGKKTVNIAYKISNDTRITGTPLDAAGIYIAFDRSAGQLMTIGQAARLNDPTASPPNAGFYYTRFVISSADRTVNVELASQTGRATIS